jgi:hypothetical protein
VFLCSFKAQSVGLEHLVDFLKKSSMPMVLNELLVEVHHTPVLTLLHFYINRILISVLYNIYLVLRQL